MSEEKINNSFELVKEWGITPSLCDKHAKLSVPAAFSLFMDIAAIHSQELGIGYWERKKLNQFWMIAKTRIHFIEKPSLGDTVQLSTNLARTKVASSIRNYAIKSGNKLLVEGKAEWLVADKMTGRFIYCNDIYGDDIVDRNEILLKDAFERTGPIDGKALGDYIVQAYDIDVGQHMNNVAYIRAFESMFTTDEWDDLNFSTIEIHYKKQCFEGQRLHFKSLKTENESITNIVLDDGSIAADIFTIK